MARVEGWGGPLLERGGHGGRGGEAARQATPPPPAHGRRLPPTCNTHLWCCVETQGSRNCSLIPGSLQLGRIVVTSLTCSQRAFVERTALATRSGRSCWHDGCDYRGEWREDGGSMRW